MNKYSPLNKNKVNNESVSALLIHTQFSNKFGVNQFFSHAITYQMQCPEIANS